MQCEFSKEELIQLDTAVLDKAMLVKLNIRGRGQKDNKRLAEHIEQLDQLHKKLQAFTEQAAQ